MDSRRFESGLISLVMPYYRNPRMLEIQSRGWDMWPRDLKQRFEIIIVDDGSPDEKAVDIPGPDGFARYAVYRVMEDRPWHQHGARNLGAHVAEGAWLLLTDMDHVVEPEVADGLAYNVDEEAVDPGTVYMFDRIEADTRKATLDQRGNHKPHPNSWFLTREAYWNVGGYDEDYCGVYGTDALLRRRCFERYARGQLTGLALVRYWRDLVPDASTRDFPRKEGRPEGATAAVREAKIQRGEADVIKVLQFPWQCVLDNRLGGEGFSA